MLPSQMSLWQLESIQDVLRILCLKFHQNRVSNSWDIADIEFLWWWLGGGVVCKVIFVSNPTYVRLSWVVVELGFWQYFDRAWVVRWCGSNFMSCCMKIIYSYNWWKNHLLSRQISNWTSVPDLMMEKPVQCTPYIINIFSLAKIHEY